MPLYARSKDEIGVTLATRKKPADTRLTAIEPVKGTPAIDRRNGPWANVGGTGLQSGITYDALIRAAFQPAYWSSPAVVDSEGRVIVNAGEPSGPRGFSQMAYNFGLFFGVAVQAYEGTLVSDDSPDKVVAWYRTQMKPMGTVVECTGSSDDVGNVRMDRKSDDDEDKPVSCEKESGHGSEGGIEGLEAYTVRKFIAQA